MLLDFNIKNSTPGLNKKDRTVPGPSLSIHQNLTPPYNHGKMVTIPLRPRKIRNLFVTQPTCKRLCEKGDGRWKIANRNGNNMMRIFKGFLCVLIFFAVLECSSVPTKKDSNWIGYTESGKASYYAMKFQSKKTASGELYDKAKMTAAHKKLPFGTIVKVTNKKNSNSVIVKINDRGPFVKGRIVDLSGSAFGSIANLDTGVIEVKIEVIR